MIPLNLEIEEGKNLANILGCKIPKLPTTYLGVLLYWRKRIDIF